MRKPFWISWIMPEGRAFVLETPWWISGVEVKGPEDAPTQRNTICAAVLAQNEFDAKHEVAAAFEGPMSISEIEFRFVEEKPKDWQPFSERFPRADWMKWDEPLSILDAG